METKIKKASLGDTPFIMALWRECFSTPWSETSVKDEISNGEDVFLVAERGGVFSGYALMKCLLGEGQLCNIAVSVSERGHGVGSALLGELISEAKRRDITVIMLEVRASNGAAIRLYEGAGFVRVGTRKNYYREPVEDALLYDFYI